MGRMLRAWYRKDRKSWFVELNGKQVKVGKTKQEADAVVKVLRKQAPKERLASLITSAEVLERYLEWCEENRAKRTYEWYKDFLQKFMNACKAVKLPAGDLKASDVTEWVGGQGWKASTRRGAMICVQRSFNWAVRQGLIDRSPISSLEKPMAERRENHVTPKALESLLAACTRQEHRDLLAFSFETGARPQEIRRLEGKHFNEGLRAFLLPVSQSKGKKRIRAIYLSEKALEITRRRMNDGHILRNSRGTPWTAYAVHNLFQRLAKVTGLHYCQYDFRHGRATQLLESGVDHLTVAAILGHVDGATLARVYSHVGTNAERMRSTLG